MGVATSYPIHGVAAVISSNEQYATAIDGSGPEPGPEPLAQTSDGKCKIMSMDDEGSTTDFLYGSAWNVNGTGLPVRQCVERERHRHLREA